MLLLAGTLPGAAFEPPGPDLTPLRPPFKPLAPFNLVPPALTPLAAGYAVCYCVLDPLLPRLSTVFVPLLPPVAFCCCASVVAPVLTPPTLARLPDDGIPNMLELLPDLIAALKWKAAFDSFSLWRRIDCDSPGRQFTVTLAVPLGWP